MTHAAEGTYRSQHAGHQAVLVTTGNDVSGYRITQYLGIVRGIVVRSASIGQGIVGAFKSMAGGNIAEFAEVCESARQDAYVLMLKHAEDLGAHAIIGMRYDATEFYQGATEVWRTAPRFVSTLPSEDDPPLSVLRGTSGTPRRMLRARL